MKMSKIALNQSAWGLKMDRKLIYLMAPNES